MAKIEKQVKGDFRIIISKLDKAILNNSINATLEEVSEYHYDGFDFALRVYERYSWTGSNRLTLTLSVVGKDSDYKVVGITSGGSQEIFFKLNTVGEKSFLKTIEDTINSL